LLRFGSAGDRRADIEILQTPGQRQLRHAASKLLGNRNKLPYFFYFLLEFWPLKFFTQPFKSRLAVSCPFWITVVVLARQQPTGQRAPNRCHSGIPLKGIVFFETLRWNILHSGCSISAD
jgi:hypothetical protein